MTRDHRGARVALSVAMREGSRSQHRQAEAEPFVADLLAGRVSPHAYAGYLLRLRAVYETLESTLRAHADAPVVSAVHDPALERLAALDADLDHWCPEGPRRTDSPAASAYRARIRQVASNPTLLVAHHYTRYLGDLSGGQAIGRLVERAFGLRGGGCAFYAFPAVASPRRYKDAYRARLDSLDLTVPERDRLVAEVNVAFDLNRSLLGELTARG